ncbi:MAG: SDR family NAD(P)-dependent oxidoreductase [Aphanocapsa lilacina HA4352-LM1]|jgi:NAD(P)-dependent dehydrogenase (short-subunit alcohol dehydrogenase family)|nr:SDR family NAD(P)-dependent oxidoreductase [Aphanocapsa lilacina HA4352-LM1]
MADRLECALPEDATCLLSEDGSQLTPRLAAALSARGWRVVVLAWAEAAGPALPAGIERVVVPAPGERDIQAVLAAIRSRCGTVRAFVHLHPPLPMVERGTIAFLPPEAALIEGVFYLAKHLKSALEEAARSARSCFMTVARLDGRLGVEHSRPCSALAGGLFGLSKSLHKEWPNVYCRAVDLCPDLAVDAAVDCLLAELDDPDRRLVEVGHTGEQRTTLTCAPEEEGDEPAGSPVAPLGSHSVLLVSGGARGITARCVVHLARLYRCRFVLLGRSAIDGPEPPWAADGDGEQQLQERLVAHLAARGDKPEPRKMRRDLDALLARREVVATLEAVERAGGKAFYYSVDVSDPLALEAVVRSATAQAGPITGLIHGAGNIADKRIEHKTEQDFRRVYGAKVAGLANLLRWVPAGQLEQLILFSSVVGFFGNIGQSDYAIANEILNKVAHAVKYHHPDCHVTAIDWGAWDGGMVTPELIRAYRQQNLPLPRIAIETGVGLLAGQLLPKRREQVQVVIGEPLAPAAPQAPLCEQRHWRIARRMSLAGNPFVRDHTIGEHPVLPSMCAAGWMVDGCEQLFAGYRCLQLQDFRVLKGIVFDGGEPETLYLDIAEPGQRQSGRIELDTQIWSQTGPGPVRRHFSGRAILLAELPSSAQSHRSDLAREGSFAVAPLYEDGTLFHGPSFRGLEAVLSLDARRLEVRCRVSSPDAACQGQFPARAFNPYILDQLLQAALIFVQHHHRQGCLPARVECIEQFRSPAFGEVFTVDFECTAHSEAGVVGEAVAYDAGGRLCVRMQGMHLTMGPQLKSLFARSGRARWKA